MAVVGRRGLWMAAVTVGVLAGAGGVLAGQGGSGTAVAQNTAAAQNTTGAQQQQVPNAPTPGSTSAVPDAPKPQTLPALNSITPVAPALPDLPGPQRQAMRENAPSSADPTVPNENGDTAALPGSSGQKKAAPAEEEEKDVVVPVGQGPTVLRGQGVSFVNVPFTVKDTKNQLVPGISLRDVRVYENGLRQRISFFSTDPFPLSVALVIDQSLTFDTMQTVNNSLAALQNAFSPYDEVAVLTYGNGVKLQDGFDAAQSARLGVILDRSKAPGRDPVMGLTGPLSQTTNVNNRQFDPNTAPVRGQQGITLNAPREVHTLNDAILAAAVQVAKAAKGRRRIIYVISDGHEYGSQAKEKQVIEFLQSNDIAVYATLVGSSSLYGMGFLDRIHLPLTMRDNVLPRYAAATGGQIDPELRQQGIERSFARITDEVRNQYTLGYITHEPVIDGKYRKVEVRVMRPNLTVIAKDGYYPRASQSAPPPPAAPMATP